MINYDRQELGQYLKEVRTKASMTQAQVSKQLGYGSPQFLSNIERGVCVVPVKTLARLIRLYRVGPNRIVEIFLRHSEQHLRKELGRRR